MELSEIENKPEQEDIEYLQDKLEQTHYDLYRNVDKETLTNALSNATKVDEEFFTYSLQEALALIGDAHTHVPQILHEDHLPISFKYIEGGYYVVGCSTVNSSLIGKQVLEINGYKIEDVLSKLSKLSSKENSEVLLLDLERFLTSTKALRYYGFSDSNTFEVKTTDNRFCINADEDPIDKSFNPLRWKEEDLKDPTYSGNEIYQFRLIGNTLLFQYNECDNYGHTDIELSEFKKKLLDSFSNVSNIVVDLRQNYGGDTGIMDDVFKSFPKNKEIYVVMGREVFSSAMHHLMYLKLERNAVLIGENAGQRPNRFGDRKDIVLPNSKIMVACSYKYFELLPGQDIDVIEPDIRIPVTIEDYINNIDPLNKWIKDNL